MYTVPKELYNFLKEHFIVKVKDGKEIERPDNFNSWNSNWKESDLHPNLKDYHNSCLDWSKATKVIKLPTLREFVRVALNNHSSRWPVEILCKYYLDFTALNLELWMFLPTKDGELLEEPKEEDFLISGQSVDLGGGIGVRHYCEGYDGPLFDEAVKQYQQAKERVLFYSQVVYLSPSDPRYDNLKAHLGNFIYKDSKGWYFLADFKTIEDTIPHGLYLLIK